MAARCTSCEKPVEKEGLTCSECMNKAYGKSRARERSPWRRVNLKRAGIRLLREQPIRKGGE